MKMHFNFQWSLVKTLRIISQLCCSVSVFFLGKVADIVFISGSGVGWQCLVISVLVLAVIMFCGYHVLLRNSKESKELFLFYSVIILFGVITWPFYIRSYYPVEELISLDAREMLLWSSLFFYSCIILSAIRKSLMTGPERVLADARRILEADK